MARPKKKQHEQRTQQTNSRWTAGELAQIDQDAARLGLTRSDLIRRRALDLRVPALSPSSSADPALIVALNKVGNNVNQLARSVHRGSDFQRYWQEVGGDLRTVLAKALEGLT